ncbi:DNA cytosine methyltransferase [Desulfoscipio geothermicus]|uniref:DNA (cytosine-5-)-methyltransferase n=1 Tax=Desulfoscipio geothermicus DSM 3669 TaxID=1121426 RepID=A0A1I6DP46_9FIRM|nr:DNA cytosine methyltransferase [Desulfoscipio geothermicus]SFR07132.1 Site-specific DNA-cytosine methylase [Desulfoscipio geothermicus DSM 3669]
MTEEFKILHIFCGLGGAALGFQRARAEWRGIRGCFRTIAGIDCDSEACEDFQNLTGAPAIHMDLFERRDYIAYHGKEPPADWREITPHDLHMAVRETPDVIFLSPPCKGFSSLLPKKTAATEKYQALNRLVVRGLFLVMEAWRDYLPGIILIENVPRITSRGKGLLHTVKGLLTSYGYAIHEGFHDCGEVGGLAQHRRRYLLIARHPEKVTSFVYKPPIKRVKSIGEVIGPLPFPDDIAAGGPMHRLPRLEWKTWVRLALIPAGGDWRDLERITDKEWYSGAYRIVPWDYHSGTITGGGSPSCGGITVADPRLGHNPRKGVFGVAKWEQPAGTVVGSASVRGSNGVAAVADPRIKHKPRDGSLQVASWGEPAGPVLGSARVNSSIGMAAIADPRPCSIPNGYGNKYQVIAWHDQSCCVTGSRFGSGAPAISDPRPQNAKRFNNKFKLVKFDDPSPCVTGIPDIQAGAISIADPRLGCRPRSGSYGVMCWDNPSSTVLGAGDVHSGATAVADPRIPADTDRPDPPPVIIALDGTWHRPLTTYELAMLQGFPTHMPDGRPLQLAGKSDRRWRQRIGDAVPPASAEAWGVVILRALLPSRKGAWAMGATDIWVEPFYQENNL